MPRHDAAGALVTLSSSRRSASGTGLGGCGGLLLLLGELFDGTAKLFVGLILLRLRLFVLVGHDVGILRRDEVIRLVGYQNIGSDGHVLNRLAARSVVLGNREDQRAAVLEIDGLLDRAVPVRLVAQNVAASIIQNRTGNDFSWLRRWTY